MLVELKEYSMELRKWGVMWETLLWADKRAPKKETNLELRWRGSSKAP